MCPEVCLFEVEHSPINFARSACSSGDWDNYRTGIKGRILEEKHYSECSEYSKYCHKLTLTKLPKTPKKIRIKIPQGNKVRAELQREIKSKCPFCNNEEVGHFEIHHIDNDPSNNKKDNLLLLCPICHSKISKGDITQKEVYKVKSLLIKQ